MFTHTMRFFRHLFSNPWQVKRHFSAQALQHIEAAITASESKHTGEIRFVVEAGLHPYEILSKKTPRNRAIELFSLLNIWDTEQNNGVLIYLLLADRDVEIVADRGIDRHIGYDQWEMSCHEMEVMFRRGEFEQGVMQGLQLVSKALEQHFGIDSIKNNRKKAIQRKTNELPDKPLIL
ncbi:MAG: TPM domain-containing protein [Methylophilaceae bacterium]|nr:MAG: TPM domain-containing protein [Methylophilaceae bacterium]